MMYLLWEGIIPTILASVVVAVIPGDQEGDATLKCAVINIKQRNVQQEIGLLVGQKSKELLFQVDESAMPGK